MSYFLFFAKKKKNKINVFATEKVKFISAIVNNQNFDEVNEPKNIVWSLSCFCLQSRDIRYPERCGLAFPMAQWQIYQ